MKMNVQIPSAESAKSGFGYTQEDQSQRMYKYRLLHPLNQVMATLQNNAKDSPKTDSKYLRHLYLPSQVNISFGSTLKYIRKMAKREPFADGLRWADVLKTNISTQRSRSVSYRRPVSTTMYLTIVGKNHNS